jgi:hypothetical protein
VTFTTVGEAGDGNAAATVDDIDGLGVGVEREGYTELLNGVEVEFVLLVSVEGEEDVQAGGRVFAVYQRVAGTEKNLGNLLVARHDDDDLRSRCFVKNRFDPAAATNGVSDKLVDTEQPGDGQETGEGPKGEPLEKANHLLGEVLGDLRRKRQGDDHDGQEDGTVAVRHDSHSRRWMRTVARRREYRRRWTECEH